MSCSCSDGSLSREEGGLVSCFLVDIVCVRIACGCWVDVDDCLADD